jgi:hypothetical protein
MHEARDVLTNRLFCISQTNQGLGKRSVVVWVNSNALFKIGWWLSRLSISRGKGVVIIVIACLVYCPLEAFSGY